MRRLLSLARAVCRAIAAAALAPSGGRSQRGASRPAYTGRPALIIGQGAYARFYLLPAPAGEEVR